MLSLEFEFDTREADDFVRRWPDRADWVIERTLQRLAAEAARKMRVDAPKAQSTLTQSIKDTKLNDTTYQVGPGVNYADFVLTGRKPGRLPPFQAIHDWVRVKGIGGNNPRAVTWAIMRGIARQGTRGQDYITPSLEFAAKRMPELTAAFISQALRQ